MTIAIDKYVKIMFDKFERIPEVNGIELYIQLESRAEVGIEEIQQTTTSLQVTVPNAQYECSTHVEDDDVHADDDDDDDDDGESDDDDYVDETIAINGEDFVNRHEFEERIERGDFGDFERNIDDDETLDGSQPDADNVISVQNIMDTIPAYAPPTLSFLLGKIWLILHILRHHLCLLRERG